MGVSGITQNKLFKVRTLDPNNLYQVGVNGVMGVVEDNGLTSVIYEIDDIIYTSYLPDYDTTDYQNYVKIPYKDVGRKQYRTLSNSDPYATVLTGNVTKEKIPGTRSSVRFAVYDANGSTVNRTVKPTIDVPSLPSGNDTTYVTKNFSYDNFVINNIVKKEPYVGLIDYPIVESDLFMERDEYTIFERHQRLSEINNLATLQNYRGGYFKNIKTL